MLMQALEFKGKKITVDNTKRKIKNFQMSLDNLGI